jgi:hypothetical protein
VSFFNKYIRCPCSCVAGEVFLDIPRRRRYVKIPGPGQRRSPVLLALLHNFVRVSFLCNEEVLGIPHRGMRHELTVHFNLERGFVFFACRVRTLSVSSLSILYHHGCSLLLGAAASLGCVFTFNTLQSQLFFAAWCCSSRLFLHLFTIFQIFQA